MKTRISIAIMLFAIPLVLVEELSAKCAAQPYKILGKIIDASSKQGVAEATLLFFFDNYQTTWSGGYDTKYPDFFKSSGNGDFTASAWFDTFKSYSARSGHNCDAKPITLTIIVTAPEYLSKRIELGKKDLLITEGRDESIIHLKKPVELEKSK
jgi:hypothetical protein